MASFKNGPVGLWPYKKDLVPGEKFRDFRGLSNNLSTTFQTVWGEASIYQFPPLTGSQFTVSSSSANDTALGTGTRSTLLCYLDSDYIERFELIPMNGQNGVLTTSTDIIRINAHFGFDAGTGKINEGIIYVGTGAITAGKPATVYSHMAANSNFAKNGVFTVPAGKGYNETTFIASSNANKNVEVRFMCANFFGNGEEAELFDGKDFREFRSSDLYGLAATGDKIDFRLDAKVETGTGEFSFLLSTLVFDT